MKIAWLIFGFIYVVVEKVSCQTKTKHYFYCHLPYGSMPDWTDSGCKRYWSCDDYDLSLVTCHDETVYNYSLGECVHADHIDCDQQIRDFVDSLQDYLHHHTLMYTESPIFTDDNGETHSFSESPYCHVANGSLPDWTDETCRRYWNCFQYTLSLETCGENEAYYYGNGSCINKEYYSCEDQNSNFRASLPVPRFPQDGVNTHPSNTNFNTVDFDFNSSGTQTPTDETIEPDWHASAVKQPPHLVEPQEMMVVEELCERLDVEVLEAILNTAVISMTGCPETNCTLPLFNLRCP